MRAVWNAFLVRATLKYRGEPLNFKEENNMFKLKKRVKNLEDRLLPKECVPTPTSQSVYETRIYFDGGGELSIIEAVRSLYNHLGIKPGLTKKD